MDSITADQFASILAKTLEEYEDGVEEKVEQTIKEVAKDTLKDLQNNPIIPERSRDKNYKNSFYLKKIKGKGEEQGTYKIVVTNKKYWIGHLLENGHLTRNGSRTKAYPHWKRAQEVADKLPDKLKEVLG